MSIRRFSSRNVQVKRCLRSDEAPAVDCTSVPLRIGLFGGTFDPPHVGHLVTAVNVRHALALDAVVLMVSNSPWQKGGTREISAAEDRFAMVEAAVADVKGLVAGDAEIRRGGPSFTADTLAGMARNIRAQISSRSSATMPPPG